MLDSEAGRDLVDVAQDEILVSHALGMLEIYTDDQGKALATFTDLPPKEAIRFFRSKRIVSPDEFKRLTDNARVHAFAVAGLEQRYAAAAAHDVLAKAIEEGTTADAAIKDLRSIFKSAGLAGPERYHLDTVFRNATQGAYAAGRWQQQRRIMDRRPFWQYRTVGDDAVRDSHREMDGRVFRATDPIWGTWYPPNGHNCRCRVDTLRELPEDAVIEPPDVKPDPGWEGSPAPAKAIEGARTRVGQFVERGRLLRPPKVAVRGRKVHSYAGDLGPGRTTVKGRKVDRVAGVASRRAAELARQGPFSVADAPKTLRGTQREAVLPLPSNLDLSDQLVERIGADPRTAHLASKIELSSAATYEAGSTTAAHLVSDGKIIRGTDAVLRIRAKESEIKAIAEIALGLERGNPLTMRNALDQSPAYLRGLRTAPGYVRRVLNWRKLGRRVEVRLTEEALPGFNAENVLVSKAKAESLR